MEDDYQIGRRIITNKMKRTNTTPMELNPPTPQPPTPPTNPMFSPPLVLAIAVAAPHNYSMSRRKCWIGHSPVTQKVYS